MIPYIYPLTRANSIKKQPSLGVSQKGCDENFLAYSVQLDWKIKAKAFSEHFFCKTVPEIFLLTESVNLVPVKSRLEYSSAP